MGVMCCMKNLCLYLSGEKWVSYPLGLKFPALFAGTYPFRGRGFISHLLFVLNKSQLDRLLLRKEDPPLPIEDVAWLWPSPKRSRSRFYGYRVESGRISAYIKVASGGDMARLAKEVENVKKICSCSPKTFKVPKCLSVQTINGCLVAEFEPLPEGVCNLPDTMETLNKVDAARREIAGLGYAHGDFLSHNIKVANGDLWIIDWEEMMENAPVSLDEISFNTAFAHFHRGKSMQCVWSQFASDYMAKPDKREHAIEALRSMSARNIGLGGKLLECMKSSAKWVSPR